MTDQELVAACLQGRESAYALLVQRYTPRLHRIAAAIEDLPSKYRQAVTLRFQEGLSPKEIAEHLGLPERTVRTHLLRGLRALKESVGDLE